MIRKILFIFSTLLVFFFLLNYPKSQQLINNYVYFSPCDIPITFRLGTISSQFNISQSEFLADVEEAANIWNNAYGKKLFSYDQKSSLPINLVYDGRQGISSDINNLNNQLEKQNKALNPQIEEYQNKVKEFESRLDKLNKQISYWNSKGGAPQDVFKQLTSEQSSLQKEADSLNAMARSLNQATTDYNAQVKDLNQEVNTFNQALQGKPEEGIYSSTPQGKQIIIYFNNTHKEFVHTIAHEMGHALGLPHNNNIRSVMYPRTNEIIAPSNDDLNSLVFACQKRSIFQNLIENIKTLVQQLQTQT